MKTNLKTLEDAATPEAIADLASMDFAARKAVLDSLDGTQAQKDSLHAYIAEVKQRNAANAKLSFWQRAKRAIAKPFKAVGRFFQRLTVPAPVRTAARFVAKNWGYMLAGAVWLAAFVVAPVPTLYGTVVISAGWVLMDHDNWFVRAMGRTLLDAGTRIIVDGVFSTMAQRRR